MVKSEKYIPQKGDTFNAVIRDSGYKIAVGCPCKYTGRRGNYIIATDKFDNDGRKFALDAFRFVKITRECRVGMPRREK
jgi:hypothetical protein